MSEQHSPTSSAPGFCIGQRPVGPGHPVLIVAELSANHHNDLDIALRSVEAAARAGADAIKVQTYSAQSMTLDSDRPEFMARDDSLWAGTRLFDLYKTGALPEDWHGPIQKCAAEHGLVFFSAPFDINAVTFLESLNLPVYKIASLEIVDIPLIRKVACTGKPIILSAGIASLEDIRLAIDTCRNCGNNQIAVLQCTTQYPTEAAHVNLNGIRHLQAEFDVVSGLSDHTESATAAIASVGVGGSIIEKHYTLDHDLDTLDKEFSLDPTELKQFVESIREAERMMGSATYDYSAPKQSARRSTRSLIATEDIKPGDPLGPENVKSLRPNLGLSPAHQKTVFAAVAKTLIRRGDGITWENISCSKITHTPVKRS